MTIQSRLNKDTVQLIKIANRVDFVRKQNERGEQKVIALIYISDDANPIRAMSGDSTWDAHDIEKAKRSIRRHNKTCLIIDKRDQIIN
ncbi:hypothetical protein [Acinetobacter junii]|uniref:hypothetical protein n=1 Tax=Acinetobacter junii TaxID=40215 RepID=UPI0012507887|nr:hypothetical protein [Acinetobacter junii]